MRSVYPYPPVRWASTPIRRQVNPLTGLIEGDDSGYRNIRTLPINESPLVVPGVQARPSYDGIDEYGNRNSAIALPGGLPDGQLVVRESVARSLDDAERTIFEVFDGQFCLCVLDGFRSYRRQAAGFTRLLHVYLERCRLRWEQIENNIAAFVGAGVSADGTFAWVDVAKDSQEYELLVQELRADRHLIHQLQDYTEALNAVDNQKLTPDEALYRYITIGANAGIDRVRDRVPFDFENNAHAGGGAVEVMLLDKDGRPISLVPFDYPGAEAGMDFAEHDENFEAYHARAREDGDLGTLLRNHIKNLGFLTPGAFTRSDWEYFRNVNRIRYHLAMSKGWTYYSSDNGGENWHFEPGNIDYDARTGEVLFAEPSAASSYPDSGNPGHALQKLGRNATAVWGGRSGHLLARRLGLAQSALAVSE